MAEMDKRWNPCTAGRARSLWGEILSPPRRKLPELGRSRETLLQQTRCPRPSTRSCGRHSLNSPEALVPEDIEKHVQIQLCEIDVVCYLETRKSKQMVGIEALASRRTWACGHGKVRSAKARASTARAQAKGSEDSTDCKTMIRTRTRTRTQSNVGSLEGAVTTRRIVGARRIGPTKVVPKDRERTRTQRMLTIST